MFVTAHLIQVHWTLTVGYMWCIIAQQYIYNICSTLSACIQYVCRAIYTVPNIHWLAHFCFDFRLFWSCVWVSSSGWIFPLPSLRRFKASVSWLRSQLWSQSSVETTDLSSSASGKPSLTLLQRTTVTAKHTSHLSNTTHYCVPWSRRRRSCQE